MPGELVPRLGTVLANEEVVDWQERSRRPRRAPPAAPVDAAHHGLCPAPDRRLDALDWPEGIKCSSGTGSAAAKARRCDFKLQISMSDRSPSSPRGPTRSSARPTWCSRRSIRWWTKSPPRNNRPPSRPIRKPSPSKSDLDRTRSRQGKDRRLHRRLSPSIRSTTSASRSGSPTMC